MPRMIYGYDIYKNKVKHKKIYYLADGLYLEVETFVKTFSHAHDQKRLKFK